MVWKREEIIKPEILGEGRNDDEELYWWYEKLGEAMCRCCAASMKAYYFHDETSIAAITDVPMKAYVIWSKDHKDI